MRTFLALVLLSCACQARAAPAGIDAAQLEELLGQPEAADVNPGNLKWIGDIDEESAVAWKKQLAGALKKGAKEIQITLDTPGGDFDQFVGLARELEAAAEKARVVCTVDGEAASGGFYVLQSCQVRRMTRRSALMAHEPFYQQLSVANRQRLAQYLARLGVEAHMYINQCAARTTLTEAQFAARIKGTDWYVGPDEALALHMVDEVVDSPNRALR